MIKIRLYRLTRLSVSFIVLASAIFSVSAAPIFTTKLVISDNPTANFNLRALNNEDDVCGTEDSVGRAFVYRGGVFLQLPQMSAAFVTGTGIPLAMNNPDTNGVMRVVGSVPVSLTNLDGSLVTERGCCWLVQSNSTTNNILSQETMPNRIDSTTGDEIGASYAWSVNDPGEAVGYNCGIWSTSSGGYVYGHSFPFSFAGEPITTMTGVNNSGDLLVPGIDYYPGTDMEHTADLIYPLGELPSFTSSQGVSYGTNTFGTNIHGLFVVGTGVLGGKNVAFFWQFGGFVVTHLPDPAGLQSSAAAATSVDNAGDVVGYGTFPALGAQSFKYILWKRSSTGSFTAYLLDNIVVDQTLAEPQSTAILINDNGDIAFNNIAGGSTGQNITVITPALAEINLTDANGVVGTTTVNETNGSVTALVTLQRADGFTGAVSVHYATTDGTAVAGVRYTNVSGTLTWNSGDSASKVITVPLVNRLSGSQFQDFHLTLSNPTNASFGPGSSLDVIIEDDGGTFRFDKPNYSVVDSWTNAVLTVDRTGGSNGSATLSFQTFDGTAVGGTDYTATNGTLTWAAGDASAKVITVPITKVGAGNNVDFDVLLFSQSGGLGAGPSIDGTVVTVTRPGHPVAPTIAKFTPPTPVASSLGFQLNGTQGGIFDVQVNTNLANPSGWTTIYSFTNAAGNVQVPTSVSLSGQFYRLVGR